ncbi:MAG: hypothetical protein LBQ48_07865 [Oscillospiraceae bacterium]|jgi:hypothetical protein|nr:hypothetical protein [Oscillospiraceae bacterium]
MVYWWFLLIIPALVSLLICLPVTLEILLFDSLSVTLKILFFKIKLSPKSPKEKAKHAKSSQLEEEKSGQKKKKPGLGACFKYRVKHEGILSVISDIRDAVCIVAEKLKTLLSHVSIHPLDLKIAVAGEDAAEAALTAGRLNAALFPMLGILYSAVKPEPPDVLILPRFDVSETRVYFHTRISLAPVFLLCLARPALKFIKLFPAPPVKI